jgi:hypothetical protein
VRGETGQRFRPPFLGPILHADDCKATLEEFPTLAKAVEAMKDIVRDLTPHGWRFIFNFYQC